MPHIIDESIGLTFSEALEYLEKELKTNKQAEITNEELEWLYLTFGDSTMLAQGFLLVQLTARRQNRHSLTAGTVGTVTNLQNKVRIGFGF
jgi:hypothetical protein